jgi:hypothetical protein
VSQGTADGDGYPCPCCGYLVFSEPPGSYDICPVCWWEDDALQLEFATTLGGGANAPTLAEAQRTYSATGASDPVLRAHCRDPGKTPRDAEWRPVDPARDVFETFGDPQAARAPGDGMLYYWRTGFWRVDVVT